MFKKLPRTKFFLAPIAGICDPSFRLMCEEQGAGLTFTELTSIDYIYSEQERALKDVQRHRDEKRVGLQLFGKHPEKIKNAMHIVEDKFDFFDLNAGCPANNIMGQGSGADLMGKPQLLLKMLSEIINNTNKPVTLKYRLGLNRHKENYLEIGRCAQDIGVSMITLHARHANQRYSGTAKWDRIKKLKETLNIPITGNGDIKSAEDAKKIIDETSCDYAMIGRWARGNPWCFKQINEYMKSGKYREIKPETKIKGFLKYVDDAKEFNVPFARLKIQAMQFTKGITKSTPLRIEISNAKCEEEIIKSMSAFIKKIK